MGGGPAAVNPRATFDPEPAVETILRAQPDVRLIYLFGSQTSGAPRGDSDVDLALLPERALDPRERFDLQERIALRVRLRRDVDLVDLRRASTVLRAQIVDGSRLLFDRDAAERQRFEALCLSPCARLNEERRGILEDVRRRGRSHGRSRWMTSR